jgi:hypothetical protein
VRPVWCLVVCPAGWETIECSSALSCPSPPCWRHPVVGHFVLHRPFGGEAVATDTQGNVHLAAGQVCACNPAGKLIDTIEVPERPHAVPGAVDGAAVVPGVLSRIES